MNSKNRVLLALPSDVLYIHSGRAKTKIKADKTDIAKAKQTGPSIRHIFSLMPRNYIEQNFGTEEALFSMLNLL